MNLMRVEATRESACVAGMGHARSVSSPLSDMILTLAKLRLLQVKEKLGRGELIVGIRLEELNATQ